MFACTEQEDICCVDIDGEMTIYSAGALKEKFVTVLDNPLELEINLKKVTEIDSAGVQLLMLVKRERSERGQALTLTNHSNAVVDIFELLGLVGYFNDPIVLTKKRAGKRVSKTKRRKT